MSAEETMGADESVPHVQFSNPANRVVSVSKTINSVGGTTWEVRWKRGNGIERLILLKRSVVRGSSGKENYIVDWR
jgi:hypothetical protein